MKTAETKEARHAEHRRSDLMARSIRAAGGL